MSLRKLLRHRVNIIRTVQNENDTDVFGNLEQTEVVTYENWPAWFTPIRSLEFEDMREVRKDEYYCALPPETVLDGTDRIVWEGETYELTGEPEKIPGRFNINRIRVRVALFKG